MTKVMDRIFDLSAIDWASTPAWRLDLWEQEALEHDPRCRCHQCALLFARHAVSGKYHERCCPIASEVITALRQILRDCGKSQSLDL